MLMTHREEIEDQLGIERIIAKPHILISNKNLFANKGHPGSSYIIHKKLIRASWI